MREQLRLGPAQIEKLRQIAAGIPTRNAIAIVSASKLLLEFSQPKPKQEVGVEHGGNVTIEIRKVSADED